MQHIPDRMVRAKQVTSNGVESALNIIKIKQAGRLRHSRQPKSSSCTSPKPDSKGIPGTLWVFL